MADLTPFQAQMGMAILNHKPACKVIHIPRHSGKSLVFQMARSARMQRQKEMQDKIQNAKQKAIINVTTDQDAEHWSDMAQEEYGRGDLVFRSDQSGGCWKSGRPFDPLTITSVNKFDPETNALDRKIAAVIARAQEEKLRGIIYNQHTETATAVAAPLMKPIDVAPKDGREVMLYCPDEKPNHVCAKYIKAYDKDGGGWEGWMYVDPILADIAPEGPQGATHFYELPTPDTCIAERFAAGGVVSSDMLKGLRDQKSHCANEFVVPIDNYEDERFTIDQLVELRRLRIDPVTVKAAVRRIHSVKMLPVTSVVVDPSAVAQPIDTSHDAICPVVNIRPKSNEATVILPSGECQRVTPIPTLL